MIVNIPLPLLLLMIAWTCLVPIFLGGLIWMRYYLDQEITRKKEQILDWITDEIFTEARVRARRGF